MKWAAAYGEIVSAASDTSSGETSGRAAIRTPGRRAVNASRARDARRRAGLGSPRIVPKRVAVATVGRAPFREPHGWAKDFFVRVDRDLSVGEVVVLKLWTPFAGSASR
jgi:hypothetical protein